MCVRVFSCRLFFHKPPGTKPAVQTGRCWCQSSCRFIRSNIIGTIGVITSFLSEATRWAPLRHAALHFRCSPVRLSTELLHFAGEEGKNQERLSCRLLFLTVGRRTRHAWRTWHLSGGGRGAGPRGRNGGRLVKRSRAALSSELSCEVSRLPPPAADGSPPPPPFPNHHRPTHTTPQPDAASCPSPR